MVDIDGLFNEVKKIVQEHERERDPTTGDKRLDDLGFKERELTEQEKEDMKGDVVFCWVVAIDDREISVLERSWDTSRAFQPRPDKIKVTITLKDLKSGKKVREESFSWLERGPFST